MTTKYYYKGNDIVNMIATGTQTITDYTGFPPYLKGSTTYGYSSIIDVGFAHAYSDSTGSFSNKLITATSQTVTTTSDITIPTWCNAIKIKLTTAKGSTGDKGATGPGGSKGATGPGGSKGEPGPGGPKVSCKQQDGAGGPGGDGGAGGPGGDGGDGGAGGPGGDGGDGGDGMISYSNIVYVFDDNSNIKVDFTNKNIDFSIKNAGTNLFNVTQTAGGTGKKGEPGGTGLKGEPGGIGVSGYCEKKIGGQLLYYGRTGGPGGTGGTGGPGGTGKKGEPGATGDKGAKGTSGIGAKGTIKYNHPIYTNVDLNTVSTSESTSTATVYFFAV